MNNFCASCKEEKCSSMGCENYFKCKCKCSTNGAVDITFKLTSLLSGVFMVIGSFYLSDTSKPAILIASNVLFSMGINSVLTKTLTSSFRAKRIFMDEILIDSVFNALTGLITGIFIQIGENIILSTKYTLFIVVIRALTGTFVAITSKCIEYIKNLTEKKGDLSEFVSSLGVSAFNGSVNGMIAYLGFYLCKSLTSPQSKSLMNVLVSGLGAAFANLVIQFIYIKLRKQNGLDVKKLTSAIVFSMINRIIKEIFKVVTIWSMQKDSKPRLRSNRPSEFTKRSFSAFDNSEENEIDDVDDIDNAANHLMLSLL